MPTRKQQSSSNINTKSGKKPVPGPTHLGHFLMIMLMKACRSILHVDPTVKAFIYFGVIVTLSVVSSVIPIPKSYLSSKKNIFNVYFLKLGWAWTLFSVGTYIALTSFVYCCRDFTKICKQFMRLAFGTFWWYFCTSMFRRLEANVGACTDSNYSDPKSCYVAGKNWKGFDISGHVFLQVYCSLLIIEELKTFKHWRKLEILLDDEDLINKRPLSANDISQVQSDFKTFTPVIKISVVIVTMVSILFDLMMITSTIYPFHSLAEEIPAFFIAVFGWFISYHILFRSGSQNQFTPSAVGECSLSFMK